MRKNTITKSRRNKLHSKKEEYIVPDCKSIDTKCMPRDTVSIVIPCKAGHAASLQRVVDAYVNGSVVPNEIVIGMCQAEIARDILNELKKIPIVKVVETSQTENVLAAVNRNIATEASVGDIVIYQDADDLPSPQRVEAIKYVFNNNDVVHINHDMIFKNDDFSDCDVGNMEIAKQNDADGLWFTNDRYGIAPSHWVDCHVGMGIPAVLRAVCQNVNWINVEGFEDQYYNRDVAACFGKSCLLRAKLYKYDVNPNHN